MWIKFIRDGALRLWLLSQRAIVLRLRPHLWANWPWLNSARSRQNLSQIANCPINRTSSAVRSRLNSDPPQG